MFKVSKISLFFLLFVIYQVRSLSRGRYNKGHVLSNPRSLERHRRVQNMPDVKKCEYKICEDKNGYPSKEIADMIAKKKVLLSYSGNVYEPTNFTINTRFGEDYDPLCKTKTETKFPTYMEDINNVQRLIANVEKFTQVLKFLTCATKDCYGHQLFGFGSSCEQKYHFIKLVAADVENETFEYVKFKIPSTCVCTKKRLP